MRSINFNTGIWREYAINGDENCTIRVNIADPNLEKRLREVEARADEIFSRLKEDRNPQTLFEADEELRIMLDKVFNTSICAKAFGKTNIFTPVNEDGELLFTAFCKAFGAMLEEDAKAYGEAHKPDIAAPRPEVQRYLPDAAKPAPVAGLVQPYGAQLPDISQLTDGQKRVLMAQLIS